MSLFARFTNRHADVSDTQHRWRRRIATLVAPALLALGMASGAFVPQAQAQSQAQAGLPDLDVVSCTAVDDPVDYGDGIDWYKIQVTYKNKGTAASGSFKYLARPSWGFDLFSGKLENEAYVIHDSFGLQAGQSVSTFFWVTKNVVQKKTWGIFLDNDGFNHGTIAESIEGNNHCTPWANP